MFAQPITPRPKVGDWMATNVQFHTGEVLPSVRLHYRTVGAPFGMPVLVRHASTGSGDAMLGAGFGGELFARGQPLDAEKYFIVIPDALGAGPLRRRHADVAVGRVVSGLHGRPGADGVDADARSPLDRTAHADRHDPERSGLHERRIPRAASEPKARHGGLKASMQRDE